MTTLIAKPKIIAIGGAGIKIAARLKGNFLAEFDILGIDLSAPATAAPFEIFTIGDSTLELFGSGGDPDVVRHAAEAKQRELEAKLQGANLLFIVAGLGGGTASALAPIIAETAGKLGALVVVFAAMPFASEGSRRTTQAREALGALRATGAMVAVLSNETLLRASTNISAAGVDAATGAAKLAAIMAGSALDASDRSIAKGIRGLTSMICAPGLIELDFEKLKKVLVGRNAKTLFAHAEAVGEQALQQVFGDLIACGLLQANEVARSADHMVLAIKMSPDIGLKEVNDLSNQLAEKFGARGEKIVGASIDPTWSGSRIEAIFIGQPDPEIRKKQNAAMQAVSQAAKNSKAKRPPSAQTEFGFNALVDQRGFFEGTDPNIYRGEDVDVPAYLRRGVKVGL
jgi:cell division protein FtsZ